MRWLPFAALAAALLSPAATAQDTNCASELLTQADVDAFDCTSLPGELVINGPAITNLDGLSELTAIGGDLAGYDNGALTDLDGLAALTSVGGTLLLAGNDALTNVDGLGSLAFVGGDASINGHDALTDLDGLASLTSVGGYLSITRNDALANIDALAGITSIGGYLFLYRNRALRDVDGLAGVTSVGGDVFIQQNDALTHLDGLARLAQVDGDVGRGLYVVENPALVRCAVGLGPILAADQTDPDVIGAPNTFATNAPGGDCNSEADVLAAYLPTDAEAPAGEEPAEVLGAFPNPATGRATLRFTSSAPTQTTLILYDALGREVTRPVEGIVSGLQDVRLDTSALPAGLYVARLVAGDRVETVRLTVVR